MFIRNIRFCSGQDSTNNRTNFSYLFLNQTCQLDSEFISIDRGDCGEHIRLKHLFRNTCVFSYKKISH
jgi:hypothetical protein